MGHLDEDALVGHAAGTLTGAAAAQAEAHLQQCAECTERLHRISSLILAKTHANLAGAGSQHATERVTAGGIATPADQRDTQPVRGPIAAKGTTFGRYVLLERLGTGGMGEVYKANDPQLDRTVALKILRPGTLGNEEGQARLWREAQAMARLSHPNVVAVHDVGRADDKVFIAMEFVDGESLSEWLRGGHPWPQVLELLTAAGAGLAAAHDAGLVHRDFKPDNVLIGQDGRPRVLDFGLARHTSARRENDTKPELPDVALEGPLAAQLTRDGTIMGTPGYMAPEQLSGLPTDARSDQFSFCVAAWEALYGKRPYGGATLKAHAEQLSAGKLPSPPAGTQVPKWVHKALARGLKPDPLQRWHSMHALLEALQPRLRRRSSKLAATAVGVLGLLAAGAMYTVVQNRDRLKVCGGTRERLAGIWDEPTRRELAASFGETEGLWKATAAALDGYANDWAKASEEACVRGRLQKTDTEAMYTDKTLCLESHLRQLQSQVRVLASADARVRTNALRAVRSLDPVAQCSDVLALAGRRRDRAATHSKEEEALAAKLRDARALYDSGQFKKASEEAMAALLGGGPSWLLADGWLLAGRAQDRAGQAAAAEKSFFEAAVHAETAGTSDAAARAWARLASVSAATAREYAVGRRYVRLARASAQRSGLAPDVDSEVENSEGELDLSEGTYESARDHFVRALTLQRAAYGDLHPETAMTLNNLGVAYSKLGDHDRALETYQAAHLLHLQTSGEEHPNTASTLQNMAVILIRKRQLSEALENAQKALAIREKTLGPDSPEVATTLGTLSRIHRKLDKPELSLAALRRAHEIRKKENPESLALAAVEDDLAHFYLDRGDYKEALTWAQSALATMDKQLGPENPRVAGTRELLGVVLLKLGSWEKSRAELDRALAVRRARLGDTHFEVASSLNALGDLELAQGNGEAARKQYQRALEVREAALKSKDTPELASDWRGVGRSYLALKKPAEAVAALERAVELREKGDEPKELALARFDLAQALWETGGDNKQRALALCEQAKGALPADGQGQIEKWLAAKAQ